MGVKMNFFLKKKAKKFGVSEIMTNFALEFRKRLNA